MQTLLSTRSHLARFAASTAVLTGLTLALANCSGDLEPSELAADNALGATDGSETAKRMLRVANDETLLCSVPGIGSTVCLTVTQSKPSAGYTTLAELDLVPYTGETFFSALEAFAGACGDGTVQSVFETCDDGNATSGDACPSTCSTPGGTWTGQATETTTTIGTLVVTERSYANITHKIKSSHADKTCWTCHNGACGITKFRIRSYVSLVNQVTGKWAGSIDDETPGRIGLDAGVYDIEVRATEDCPAPLSAFANYAVTITTQTHPSRCGDGKQDVDFREACDDGNANDGDACFSDCTWNPVRCGNGIIEAGEECDAGWRNGGACDTRCKWAPLWEAEGSNWPSISTYSTERGVPSLGAYRIAQGNLAHGGADRISFDRTPTTFNATATTATAPVYHGHIEMDCSNAAVSYALRGYVPYDGPEKSPSYQYAKGYECHGYVTSGDALLINLAVFEGRKLCGYTTDPFVGRFGGLLKNAELRSAPTEGQCPSQAFVVQPSFCATNKYRWNTQGCFYPVLDIEAQEPFAPTSVPWRVVIDKIETKDFPVVKIAHTS